MPTAQSHLRMYFAGRWLAIRRTPGGLLHLFDGGRMEVELVRLAGRIYRTYTAPSSKGSAGAPAPCAVRLPGCELSQFAQGRLARIQLETNTHIRSEASVADTGTSSSVADTGTSSSVRIVRYCASAPFPHSP